MSYIIQVLIVKVRKLEENVLLYQQKGTILQDSWNASFKRNGYPPKSNALNILSVAKVKGKNITICSFWPGINEFS